VSLSSLQLDAFHAVARHLSFSRAAKELHVTQSALSQRVKKLEEDLGQLLFVRGAGGLALTETGHRLLRYCQTRAALEAEVVSDLAPARSPSLVGTVRIAGYSSVMRSVVFPAVAPVFRAHPKLNADITITEMTELESMLARAGADFVMLDHVLDRDGVERLKLGDEELVLVESTQHDERRDVYLDHEPDDETTIRFLRRSRAQLGRIQRSFLDNIYGVIDGAVLGLGRAVLPRHLLSDALPLRIVPGHKVIHVPVILHYWKQPSYSRVHEAVVEALKDGVSRALAAAMKASDKASDKASEKSMD
jgi:DNA-binding transcriptional LysR family regulator